MYTVKVMFQSLLERREVEQSELIQSFLGSWRMNGQILGREFLTAYANNLHTLYLNTPTKNSLDMQYNNKYVNKNYEALSEVGLLNPKIEVMGIELESKKVCDCKINDIKSYILYTIYLSVESPLLCGECFGVMPLYKIPKTYDDDEYYNIIRWQSDYNSCDSLQMNSKIGEEFAIKQLSLLNSELTQDGLEICKKIEELSDKKVYYYLYKDRAKSLKEEKKKECPKCHKEWYQDKPWHGLFNFVCKECGLLSNVAWDLEENR